MINHDTDHLDVGCLYGCGNSGMPTPTTTQTVAQPLPHTGSDAMPQVGFGLILIVAGLAALTAKAAFKARR